MSWKKWTNEDVEYLVENWGSKSIPAIAGKLGRTVNAVVMKRQELGLGAVLDNGGYVTLNALISAVTGSRSSYSYKMTSWVKNRGLPVHTRRVNNCRFRVVYLDEFWKWAEKNRSFIDFSKFEKHALGAEPRWVAEQRGSDVLNRSKVRSCPWTAAEDARLTALLKEQRYGYSELSRLLGRSEGAIQRRCIDLGTKLRPVKADNTGPGAEWTPGDFAALADGIKRGQNYRAIGERIGKSEKAVRGKAYFIYFTENADRIRAMIGDGEWGDGAPAPSVRQAKNHTGYRRERKQNRTALVSILNWKKNDLGFDPYWQRFMCMKWDDVKGCRAGCSDCDSCAEFERIRPQACARCGGTFYERKKNRFCESCRKARLSGARRKWARDAARK